MLDPFQTLNLPRSFDLSPDQVERAYLAKAALLHPDSSSLAQDDALERSADLNRARQILHNPELRADALLTLLAGPSREQDRSLAPGFLQEMMELRETIDQELAENPLAARSKWRQWGAQRRASHLASVQRAFAALSPVPDPAALKAIRAELNAWRYIERLLEQIDAQPSI